MSSEYTVRHTGVDDIEGLIGLCLSVYPQTPPYRREQLIAQLARFPEGHFVAVSTGDSVVVGTTSSLILSSRELAVLATWDDATDKGYITNHDPSGDILYGVELMVHPRCRRLGIANSMHRARRDLVARLGIRRIRAGVRLSGLGAMPTEVSALEYYKAACDKRIVDPALEFHFRTGFRSLGIVENYLRNDPECRNSAAVMQWDATA